MHFERFGRNKIRGWAAVVSIFLLSFVQVIQAKHIIGGEITYEYVSGNTYKFTMYVYRDCFGGGADFDQQAIIGIYRCTLGNNCEDMKQKDIFMKINAPKMSEGPVDPPVYPCLTIPPNICVEKATYTWTANLPLSAESYFIVYQRCCRNETIKNIYVPGDVGATYAIELTPLAQQLKNNSPVFKKFPPTVICNNNPLVFDHSAADKEGDELYYELCAPSVGGGKTLQGPGANGCAGVIPNPACPPPFEEVGFKTPNYTSINPMGGSPAITIDPITGVITGTPNELGQFVVGVCVSEYRNGQLLSVTKRDFQFNVSDCEPFVNADVKEDVKIGLNSFLITSCGQKELNFINESTDKKNIKSYQWEFNLKDGTTEYINTENAKYTFPDTGIYTVKLYLNPGTICGDTASIQVSIFPEVVSQFEFTYDTCGYTPVKLEDKSYSGAGAIQGWKWNLDDGLGSLERNPLVIYNKPGSKEVSLVATDGNNCKDTSTQTIPFFPIPPLIIAKPNVFKGCVPGVITFTNLSSPVDTNYQIEWDFGDGTTGTGLSPVHIYEKSGLYSVKLNIISPLGCRDSVKYPNWIKIDDSPIADFDYDPKILNTFVKTINFKDKSTNANKWGWLFDDEGSSPYQNPNFTFKDTGLQYVTLIVTHPTGCKDTVTKIIDIDPIVTYYLPNAFTPNDDSSNDYFLGAGIKTGIINFEMHIYDRWGQRIFNTSNPDEGWNGRKDNVGEFMMPGVYIYDVRFEDGRKRARHLTGYATLVR